jgi:tRNA U34 5-carboxymethylaminomethyl modifying enzyme MnmG/GidA
VELAGKYAGYIDLQRRSVEAMRRLHDLPIPDDMNFEQLTALSIEARERLSQQDRRLWPRCPVHRESGRRTLLSSWAI